MILFSKLMIKFEEKTNTFVLYEEIVKNVLR